MVLQHNIAAMNAQRQFNMIETRRAKSIEKLSSGYRVNRAADDAASLSISEKMRRQIRGLTQGVQNTLEGVSICQVGDGALAEVHDMLNRITELSVKAANGTLSQEDRSYIQQEINELIQEIDRIGDTTTFNEIPLFQGKSSVVRQPDGTPAVEVDYNFDDVKIADLTLSENPINSTSGARLALTARVDKVNSASNGKTFNLIFGDGGTSHSKLRIETSAGKYDFNLAELSSNPPTYDATTKTVSRDFHILDPSKGIDVTLTQAVGVQNMDNAKEYNLSYTVKNNSSSADVKVSFLFNADTAYNNNDAKDNYFVNGALLEKYTVYGKTTSKTGNVATNSNVNHTVPGSLSLVDKDNALPFTEFFEWNTINPDVVCVGPYSSIREWNFYDESNLNQLPSTNTKTTDLGFSVIWDNRTVGAGSDVKFGLSYGIKALSSDQNLVGNNVEISNKELIEHSPISDIWIQSGSEPSVGMFINFREMNSTVLGINKCDVTTQDGAGTSIDLAKKALAYISELRSTIGAQQVRLEHTIANEDNIIENTTAAESQIRDTDMAKEMVQLSLNNIISQAGLSMMAQANQSNQTVLSLLQ